MVIAWSEVLYTRYSMRVTVEELIKHKSKLSALLVSRVYQSAVSYGIVRTGRAINNLFLMHG